MLLLLPYLLPTVSSSQASGPENRPVLASGEKVLSRQGLVAGKEDLQQRRLNDTGQLILSSPIAFPPTPTISQAYSSNSQPISSSHGTLQARIELQRGKIRAHELAVEERRRTEQLRDRERDEQRRRDRQTVTSLRCELIHGIKLLKGA